MQRLFSAFPGGWPGVGLLLLRIVVGPATAIQGAMHLSSAGDPTFGTWSIGLLAIASGASLLLGFLTPCTGALVGLSIVLLRLPRLASDSWLDGFAALLIVADAVALALLGPGAFSLDALLFGRREILIPHPSYPPKP